MKRKRCKTCRHSIWAEPEITAKLQDAIGHIAVDGNRHDALRAIEQAIAAVNGYCYGCCPSALTPVSVVARLEEGRSA